MINKLKKRFPDAVIQSNPIRHSKMIWFYISQNEQYIGIPIADLTHSEIDLLKTLFPVYQEEITYNKSTQSKKWYDYIFSESPSLPMDNIHKEFRLIQFSISENKEAFDVESLQDVLKTIFPHEVVIVFSSENAGVIIEEKQEYLLTSQELQTSINALESDFYFKIHFYIGQFNELDKGLKAHFKLEQDLFLFAQKEMSKERIFSLNNVFPLYILKNIPYEIRSSFFNHIYHIFKEDRELRRTIKLYLENHSNASLTAKQLFLHRNSLQYRIDKFTDKTGFDLKSFPHAVIVYLACLDYEYDL
ncbi:hypothetical protein J6TS2_35830 [Heyndrickxia sporothermodurans]|nr:hypothetical protein J6TS2_35830 [Heyndrickxia sporothermodurans]